MPVEDLPPLVEVNGVRAHLHFWLRRPDGWWGGLRRTDLIPSTGFGARDLFYETTWYAKADAIVPVEGYQDRHVPRYGA